MRTVALPLLLVALVTVASAQTTTYTTTTNGCGAKNLGYCRLSITAQSGQPFDLILDARYNAQGPINTLTVNQPYPGPTLFSVHGAFSGFVANPNGTKQAYYGAGSFDSDDGSVAGSFQFYAYYIGSCAGRGCYGVTVGWHYSVLSGSTVTQQ